MDIPVPFKNILEKDQNLNGIVNLTVSQFSEILSENNLFFFEEYTNHGIKHIESVLNSSAEIIPEETVSNFLSNDSSSVSIYILATILHDIGMHLTPEGFNMLISGKNDDIRISDIDSRTWKELWEDFLDDARRFGDTEKKNIIGNQNWIFRRPEIDNKDKLTGEDKKLIGEFIRIHHPRIAHEIALKGFPAKDDNYVEFANGLEKEYKDICGLVARSHGVNIRSLFEHLESKFPDTWSKPYNIELIYLMVLLRIADYFQIDSNRVSKVNIKLKTFHSPISETEHYKHLDVKYIQPNNKDPETLSIHCNPRDSYIFIKLKDLFSDIQKELDTSWAILGEIYGKEPKEKQPKISYRRIKSNIDNTEVFSQNVKYIPERIFFNVSNELPKLLIGPLYGYDPTFGVRELLQNAVDSCREREFIEESEYSGLVKISLLSEEDKYYFKIEDNGLGMNLNVIKNYFLEVGSSLIKSSSWKKKFLDKKGQSKVQRSGKFGIGVLASFLIGDKLQLETKSVNSETGLSFTTDLNTEQIEVTKIQKKSIGTTITIEIDSAVLKKLVESSFRFDEWYLQSNPKVEYHDETDTFFDLGSKKNTPGFNDSPHKHWREIKIEEYEKVIWTYSKTLCKQDYWNTRSGNFICNGILIPQVDLGKHGRNHLSLPFISVFDFNGNLPLNLSRNDLDNGIIPFQKQLEIDIYKDIIAKLLTSRHSFPDNISNYKQSSFYHPAIGFLKLLFSKEGFILKDNFFAKKNPKKTLIDMNPKSDFIKLENFDIKESFIFIHDKSDISMSSFQYKSNIRDYNKGAKLYLSMEMYNKLFNKNYNRYPIGVRRDHKIVNSSEDLIEISYKYSSSSGFNLEELKGNLVNCNCIIESQLIAVEDSINLTSSKVFYKLLNQYFEGDGIIPFKIKDRREKFQKAFEELDYYIKKYIS